MEQKKKKPLDLTGGWEEIVNPMTRHNRKNLAQRVRRWLLTIVALLVLILLTLVLWVAKVIPSFLSLCLTFACGGVTSFFAGRLYEVVSR